MLRTTINCTSLNWVFITSNFWFNFEHASAPEALFVQGAECTDDNLERNIRSLLKSSLTNESEVHESTKQINFHTIDNVEICEMFIKASNVPIFIKSKIVTIKENNEQIKIDKMYKRTGNASTIITTFEDFLEYYKTHFIKPSSF